jgi:serine/threonine-protein kinase
LADDADWIGRVIDGRYAVDAVLGRGGMGVVLRARHKFTGGLVAVKMLHADLTRDAQIEARFLAEARASNTIGHPAIVKVLDAGRTPDGELYLVMELLAGQPMRSAVSRRLGQLAIRRIALELLDALAAAHARGFVHRDLKPENVFLADPDGTVKLLDFGIAKTLDAGAKMGTQAGVVLGTVAYMAPEQLRDAAGVDARADLWALGVMIYEMLAGRLPYRGTTVEEVFVRLAREEPDPIRAWIPTIAPAIESFMTRALARDPNARFGSAAEMAAALVQLPFETQHVPLPARGPADNSPMATQATGFGATAAVSAPGVTPISQPGQMTPPPIRPAEPRHVMPMPSPMLPPPIAQASAPNRSRTLGIVLALAAAGVIVAAIVVAKGHSSSSTPHGITTDLAIGSAGSQTPASVPPPPLDASPTPPPIDAAPMAQPQPQRETTKPRQPQPQPQQQQPQPQQQQPQQPYPQQPYPQQPAAQTDPCIAGCTQAVSCGMAQQASCVTACETNHIASRCMTNNCSALAACLYQTACNAQIFNGMGTCKQALMCQIQNCRLGDDACGCRCATGMSASHALALYFADACLLACNANETCLQQKCTGYISACSLQ